MRTIIYDAPTGYRHVMTHDEREVLDLTNIALNNVNPESLRIEWQDHHIRSMDAPDWIPAGGVYSTRNYVYPNTACLYKNMINRNSI